MLMTRERSLQALPHPFSLLLTSWSQATWEAWHTSWLLCISPLTSYLLLSSYPGISVQCIVKRYQSLETPVSVLQPQICTCCTTTDCWSIFLAVTPASVPRNTKKHEPVLVPLVFTSSQVQSNLRQSLTNKKLIFRRQLLTTQPISAAWHPLLLQCSLRKRSCCSGCTGCTGCLQQRVCEHLKHRNNVSACLYPPNHSAQVPELLLI